jgi:acetone carboxylase gamma subunit
MTIRMSATLEIGPGSERLEIRCVECGHGLAPARHPWKADAHLVEQQLNTLSQATYTASDEVVLRRFHCPGCGALLDTETAVKGDPFLNDVLFVDSELTTKETT